MSELATDLFRQSWAFYRKLIDHDSLHHRGTHAALRRFVLDHEPGPFDLWDLACGDCTGVPELFSGTALRTYTGVDAAPPALELARQTLAGVPFGVRLVESDFPLFLAGAESTSTDLIWIGLSLHHFQPGAKRDILADCRRALRPGGHLLLSDLWRRPGEDRPSYLAAFLAHGEAHWPALTPQELERIEEHIVACDYPETPEGLEALARDAGFEREPVVLDRDPTGFFRTVDWPV